MSLTRAQVEEILVRRTGHFMEAARLDGSTNDGTNADLNDPIGSAIRACGGSVDNVTQVANGDLGSVSSDDYDKLFDIAEIRVLESVLGNYDKFGLKVGPRSEYQSQLVERLEPRLRRLKKETATRHGWGSAEPSAGVITQDFAEKEDDDDVTSV